MVKLILETKKHVVGGEDPVRFARPFCGGYACGLLMHVIIIFEYYFRLNALKSKRIMQEPMLNLLR